MSAVVHLISNVNSSGFRKHCRVEVEVRVVGMGDMGKRKRLEAHVYRHVQVAYWIGP